MNINKDNSDKIHFCQLLSGLCFSINNSGSSGPTGSVEAKPYNLYVQSTAAPGGDGSQENPFQTIEEALAVSRPNGVINLLSGTYSIAQQINLNIPGLILKGRAGSLILLEAPVVPFYVLARILLLKALP